MSGWITEWKDPKIMTRRRRESPVFSSILVKYFKNVFIHWKSLFISIHRKMEYLSGQIRNVLGFLRARITNQFTLKIPILIYIYVTIKQF